MVPLLEYYAFAGVLLTAVVLHALFYSGLVGGNPLSTVLVLSFAVIPVAGVAEQALVGELSVALATGVGIGVLVSAVSHALFPDPPAPAGATAAKARPEPEAAAWIALRATLIVMPVFVLALTDPSFYLAAVMKTVALGQQAGETDARSAGASWSARRWQAPRSQRESGPACRSGPSLWMLMLWLVSAALWTGSAMFGVRRTRMRPVVLEQRADHGVPPARPGHRGQRQRQERARRRRRAHRPVRGGRLLRVGDDPPARTPPSRASSIPDDESNGISR